MNRVVLVTGGSRGIGKATIIEFAKKGYNVVINYLNSKEEALENSYSLKIATCKIEWEE